MKLRSGNSTSMDHVATRKRKFHGSASTNLSTLSNTQPKKQRLKSWKPQHNDASPDRFPLLSLPSEVIDLIIFHYLPFTSFGKHQLGSISDKVFPLALTCKAMYQLIATKVATHIEDFNLLSKFKLYPPEGSSQNLLLFQAAGIALRQLIYKKKPLPASSSLSCIRTRSMTKSSATHRSLELELTVSDNKSETSHRNVCCHSYPLLSINGHTEECRVIMAWMIFAATSDKLSTLSFYYIASQTRSDIEFEYCFLRLWKVLGLPLRELYATKRSYPNPSQSKRVIRSVLKSASQTLTDLRIDINNSAYVQAICDVKLPNLDYLWLYNSDRYLYGPGGQVKRKLLSDRRSRILNSLRRNGTKLQTLSVEESCFVNIFLPLDLETLVPTLRCFDLQAEIGIFAAFGDYMNFFKFGKELETIRFDFENGALDFEALDDIYKSGSLPSLKNIFLDKTRAFFVPSCMKNEDRQGQSVAHLIRSMNVRRIENDSKFESLSTNFTSIKRLSMDVELDAVSDFCQYLRQTRNLDQLSIYLRNRDSCRSFEARYSHEISKTIYEICPTLRTLYVHGLCVSVDQGISLLHRMGSNVRRFRLPFCEHFIEEDKYVTVDPLSPHQVIRALDVITDACPNMTRFTITLSASRIQWTVNEKLRIEAAVKRTATRLRKFDYWLFIDALENKVSNRRYCD